MTAVATVIPKGPTSIVFWIRDPNCTPEEQKEILEESANLVTANFLSLLTEIIKVCEGYFALYIRFDLRLANKTIQKHLSKLWCVDNTLKRMQ